MHYDAAGQIPVGFGFEVEYMTSKRDDVNAHDLIERYAAGESELSLARRFSVSRPVVARLLLEAGVHRRGRSAAAFIRMAHEGPDGRARLSAAAHEAVRGRSVPIAEREQRARTNARRRIGSNAERALHRMLDARGITVTPQQPIGPYNCDLACHPVAVEIFGGGWHWHGRHLARSADRLRYLLDAGWDVFVLHVPAFSRLTGSDADELARYIDRRRGEPAAVREYRVVRCGGDLLTAGRADDDEVSIVPAFTAGRDARTGRYERVAR